MAIYKFRMQGVLDIKEKLETQAKQEFANANIKLIEEEALLEEITKRKEDYLQNGRDLRLNKINTVSININDNGVEILEDMRKKQEREVVVARKNVEIARSKMMDARTQTRIYEKLKEEDFNEFMSEQGKAESKEIDELNSFRFSENKRRGES